MHACKTINFRKLYFEDFYIDDVYAMRQKWIKGALFQMKIPRKRTAIIFLNNCTALYTDKFGEQFHAPQKSVVCLPQESEYSCLNIECTSTLRDAIIVEFVLRKGNDTLTLSDKPFMLKNINNSIIEKYFTDIIHAYEEPAASPLVVKTAVYKMLTYICKEKIKRYHKCFASIEPGIELIESDSLCEYSIEEISQACNVSPCYFRRLFKEYSGKSPNEYRMELRFNMAKRMLENNETTLDYIAEALGFESASYFCKIFKKKFGVSPGKYRNEYKH